MSSLEDTNRIRLKQVAIHQRTLLICIALLTAYVVLHSYTVSEYSRSDMLLTSQPPAILSLLLLMLNWLPHIVAACSIVLLLWHMYENLLIAILAPVAIVAPLEMFFCTVTINIFILIFVCFFATKHLRTNGIRAGLFGASLKQFGE